MDYKTKTEMAWDLGSTQGFQCWCGAEHASGYNHMKVFRPYSCGSSECEELESLYQSLPEGEDYSSVFGK